MSKDNCTKGYTVWSNTILNIKFFGKNVFIKIFYSKIANSLSVSVVDITRCWLKYNEVV